MLTGKRTRELVFWEWWSPGSILVLYVMCYRTAQTNANVLFFTLPMQGHEKSSSSQGHPL